MYKKVIAYLVIFTVFTMFAPAMPPCCSAFIHNGMNSVFPVAALNVSIASPAP